MIYILLGDVGPQGDAGEVGPIGEIGPIGNSGPKVLIHVLIWLAMLNTDWNLITGR